MDSSFFYTKVLILLIAFSILQPFDPAGAIDQKSKNVIVKKASGSRLMKSAALIPVHDPRLPESLAFENM